MRNGNIEIDFDSKGNPILSKRTPPFNVWVLDESKLSEVDKIILEEVNFPRVVKSGTVVQKIIRKHKTRRGFVDQQKIELGHIRYKPFSKNIALSQVAKSTIRTNGFSQQQVEKQRNEIEDQQASKHFEAYYLNGSGMDDELKKLLATFSQPAPTPSMQNTKSVTEEKEEVAPVESFDEVKKLSPTQKSKAKKLYALAKDAEEIAIELGVEQNRVIEYLKTLVNEKV